MRHTGGQGARLAHLLAHAPTHAVPCPGLACDGRADHAGLACDGRANLDGLACAGRAGLACPVGREGGRGRMLGQAGWEGEIERA